MLGFWGSKLCKERFLVLKIARKRNRIIWNTAMNVVFWVLFCFSAEKQSTNPTFPCQTSLVDTVGFFYVPTLETQAVIFLYNFSQIKTINTCPPPSTFPAAWLVEQVVTKLEEVSLFIKRYNTIPETWDNLC